MAPTLGPDIPPSSSLSPYGRPAQPRSRSSSSFLQSSGDNVTIGSSPAYSSSSVSIPFEDGDVDVVRVEGLRHSDARLEARRQSQLVVEQEGELYPGLLLVTLQNHSLLDATSSDTPFVESANMGQSRDHGNQDVSGTRIVLLRIYGPSSDSMISRPRELQTLYVLSSQYHIGPRVYGTFENGRVEEYFDALTLTAADLRDPKISSWIAARMAELHGVNVEDVEQRQVGDDEKSIAVERNVKSWLGFAREVLALPSASDAIRQELDLDGFEQEWERYRLWLHKQNTSGLGNTRVFAHNDTQYGNLLRLKSLKEGQPEHRQIIVVDFEYAAPNPAAFDIANHFHEWTANYHSDTPHVLDPALYPTTEQRRNFYRSYIQHVASGAKLSAGPSGDALEVELQNLDRQVRAWSPASHAMWALWGIVQAREYVEGKDGDPEFDYLGYARCRMQGFRRETRELGVPL
ncbi:kinase-like protein [Laetiporus sulphureus 93-53]|uniref:Kinase-like protein n=1 Tax=Laetiporus sulphureus 93-53 TaxID=1314785 RepID=A0A165E6M6_9APHY|nr:kinase-like protein [Laetiporus sulphureus 93-53]KZT06340.1 kinase-like protein [Laetiporus sulphureus 93-53]